MVRQEVRIDTRSRSYLAEDTLVSSGCSGFSDRRSGGLRPTGQSTSYDLSFV
ncbi:hypothetical protein PAXRUDRAFT_332254 [Paxillus rubicundulus Ve08.2h10]|uniref:Uncharacterized protein n=1 Tax=Paxillus rubicundulus Ve08.2h10 TaxID=930991 RepID=A0A0D0DMX4_9AGAM|nr:hypothetical protein PAXRUDRAFT_332254 [Paxillus rubicundulus Ve08.2h10]